MSMPQIPQIPQMSMPQMPTPQMQAPRKEMAPPSFSFPMMNMMPHPQQTSNLKSEPVDAMKSQGPGSDDESERLSDVPSDLESPTPSDFPSPDNKVIELAPKKPRGRPRKNQGAAAGRVIHI
jgi:hypothetical protein